MTVGSLQVDPAVRARGVGKQRGPAAGPFAYGVGLRHLPVDLPELMVGPWDRDWPAVEFVHRTGPADLRPCLTEQEARLHFEPSGALLVERAARRAVVVAERPPPRDLLVNPYLSMVGAVFSHWAGGTALHAGGVVIGGRGWGILGVKERGKSTTLARLAQRGHPVIADDTLVVRSGHAFSAPRSIYLRPDAPARLGLSRAATERARDGARCLLALGPAPASVPLAGWIILRPGSEIGVTALTPSQRLQVLFRNQVLAFAAPSPQRQQLALAALPGFELRRPRRWDLLDVICDRVERLAQGDRDQTLAATHG